MDKSLKSFQVLSICCFLILVIYCLNTALSGLRSLPGPLLGRISNLYRLWLLSNGRGPIEYWELHKKYGQVVRIGPNQVSLSDPAMIPVIYDIKGRFFKSHFYDVFKPLYRGEPMDTIFTTSNPADKRISKRSLMINMTSCPQEYRHSIEQSVDLFVDSMHSTAGQSIDFTTWPWFWAFDMTFAIMFGDHLGFMKNRSDFNSLVEAFVETVRPAALLGQVPEWCPWTLGNARFMAIARRFQKYPDPTQELLKLILREIEDYSPTIKSQNVTFLSKVLGDQKVERDGPEHDEVVNLMFEGFFAAAAESAVTIRTIFYCLLTNEPVYRRLVRDIRSHTSHSQKSALTVPFLTAVIKESLRLHTSNCPPMERIVPSPGMSASDYYIPEGTIVSIPYYASHRDTKVFGEDVHLFRPERWLEAGTSTLQRMDQSFLAFGKGNRACPGRELGMLELRIFIVEVLRKFDVEWASGDPQVEVKMYWIIEHFGMNVRFKKIAKGASISKPESFVRG